MLYVYLKRRTDPTGQQLCSYTVAATQPTSSDASYEQATGPYASMAECDAWIASQSRILGQEWLC